MYRLPVVYSSQIQSNRGHWEDSHRTTLLHRHGMELQRNYPHLFRTRVGRNCFPAPTLRQAKHHTRYAFQKSLEITFDFSFPSSRCVKFFCQYKTLMKTRCPSALPTLPQLTRILFVTEIAGGRRCCRALIKNNHHYSHMSGHRHVWSTVSIILTSRYSSLAATSSSCSSLTLGAIVCGQ